MDDALIMNILDSFANLANDADCLFLFNSVILLQSINKASIWHEFNQKIDVLLILEETVKSCEVFVL